MELTNIERVKLELELTAEFTNALLQNPKSITVSTKDIVMRANLCAKEVINTNTSDKTTFTPESNNRTH